MKNTLNKKGQMKMMETMAVLIIFFILVAAGFVFYGYYNIESAKLDQKKTKTQTSLQTAQQIMMAPELKCTKAGESEDICIDKLKAIALSEYSIESDDLKQFFYDRFRFSYIEIIPLYPTDENLDTIVIYNNTLEDTGWRVYDMPIKLYDPIKETNQFGILHVQVYPFQLFIQ